MKKLALLVSSLFILTACSATKEECDPSKAQSFITKISCSTSGTYDQRVSDKKIELAMAEERQNKVTKEHKKAQDKLKKSTDALKAKNAELAKLNQSTKGYLEQLKSKSKGKQNILDEIANIEKQLQQVSTSGVSEEEQKAQIKVLQSKLKALEKATGI